MTTDEQIAALPRRQVLCGIMAMGLLGTTALTACSGDSTEATPPQDGGAPTTGGSAPPAAGGALATASQVPVGGGTIVDRADGPIVVVQPTAGQFKAYDARCTHQGTTVGAPANGVMTCPNHMSRFNATDGSVVNGPAGSPLKEVSITVNGDSITLA